MRCPDCGSVPDQGADLCDTCASIAYEEAAFIEGHDDQLPQVQDGWDR